MLDFATLLKNFIYVKKVTINRFHLISAGFQASKPAHQNSLKDQEQINGQDIIGLAFQVGVCILNILSVINSHEKEKKSQQHDELIEENNPH